MVVGWDIGSQVCRFVDSLNKATWQFGREKNLQIGRQIDASKYYKFGDMNSTANSVENTVLLLSREFIWVQKFTSKKLDIITYINFMKQELTQLYEIVQIKNKTNEFLKCWLPILDFFEVDYVSPSKFIDIMS